MLKQINQNVNVLLRKIFFIIIILLLFLLSFFPDPFYTSYQIPFIAGLLILIGISLFDKNNWKFFSLRRNFFFYIYIVCLSLSFIFSNNIRISSKYFYIPTLSFLLYFLFQTKYTRDYRYKFGKVLCSYSLIVLLIGILEYFCHKNLLYENFISNPFYKRFLSQLRIMSTQYHPSILGTYFLICIPFSLFLWFNGRRKFDNLLGKISFVGALIGIILSFSRAAILIILVILPFYLLKKNRKKVIIIFLIFFIIFIIGGYFLTAYHKFFKRFKITRAIHSYEFHYRLRRFPTAYKMVKDFPFFGVGFGNFRNLFDIYHKYKNVKFEFKIPDNMYLSLLTETGIIGIGGFLAFVIFILKTYVLKIKTVTGKEKEYLQILLLGFIFLLINMFSYDIFYWHMPLCFFWIYAGLIKGYN